MSQKEGLEALRALCARLGRTPLREELPPYLRMGLTECFGSLANALSRLGRRPLTRAEARALRHGPASCHAPRR